MTQLDTYETALLAELRAVVAGRPAPAPPRRSWNRRWLLVPVGITAATVTALLVLPGTGPEPAYAVTVDGDGEVHVRVHSLADAQGLERALEQQGIAADVTYLADDTECAPGRFDEAPNASGSFRFSMGDGYGYSIDMDAGVVRDGETLVISASRTSPTGDPDGDGVSDEGGATVSVGVASGTVGACVPVPFTGPDAPTPTS
jgi:hypothetical protein